MHSWKCNAFAGCVYAIVTICPFFPLSSTVYNVKCQILVCSYTWSFNANLMWRTKQIKIRNPDQRTLHCWNPFKPKNLTVKSMTKDLMLQKLQVLVHRILWTARRQRPVHPSIWCQIWWLLSTSDGKSEESGPFQFYVFHMFISCQSSC